MKNNPDIPIIYYHSVGKKNPGWAKNYLTLETKYFVDQLKYLSSNFNSISLDDFYKIRMGAQSPVQKPIVITFDDGYLDNWVLAFPFLKKYDLKATIFVSPEFVDKIAGVRPNLEDVWEGKAQYKDITMSGYLSWDEMKMMQDSGLVDIQSHTMTHTKYIACEKIVGFHNRNDRSTYYILNKFPERKPYYINDTSFMHLLPEGYPLFEQASSIITKRIYINKDFIDECIKLLDRSDVRNASFNEKYEIVKPLYNSYTKNDLIVDRVETDSEYNKRLLYEIKESKRIIEKELGNQVLYLCWPHGDNNGEAHNIALASGYKATTLGKMSYDHFDNARIPPRIGTSAMRNNRMLTLQRLKYKIKCAQRRYPYFQLNNFYQKIRYQ